MQYVERRKELRLRIGVERQERRPLFGIPFEGCRASRHKSALLAATSGNWIAARMALSAPCIESASGVFHARVSAPIAATFTLAVAEMPSAPPGRAREHERLAAGKDFESGECLEQRLR
jgi:hypothetical protein